MSFDDNNNGSGPKKGGLKLNNANSMFANNPKKPSKQEFEQKIQESKERNQDYKERAMALAISFRKILDDKTVPQNKNDFNTEIEREILTNLTNLALDMNTDEQEDEGMGSLGLIALLFRCMLIQRDKINILDYAVNQLESKIKKIESSSIDNKIASE